MNTKQLRKTAGLKISSLISLVAGMGLASISYATSPLLWKDIISGGNSTFGITPSGLVQSCGYNLNGQLGDGSSGSGLANPEWRSASGISATKIFTGSAIFAQDSSGNVKAWGSGWYGQLGNGLSTWEQATPIDIPALNGVSSISSGGLFCLARNPDGTLLSWGYGWLGDGQAPWTRYTPTLISGLTSVVQEAIGAAHCVALKSNGTVWTWGHNGNGALGLGSQLYEALSPTEVTSISNVVQIAANAYSTYALKSDGTLWAWGENHYGTIGDGTTTRRYLPTLVMSGVEKIFTHGSAEHVFVKKQDGTLWGWGNNEYGQVNKAPSLRVITPINIDDYVYIGGSEYVTKISIAGANTFFFLALDDTNPDSVGFVYGMGKNIFGQLGQNNLNP